MTAVKTTHLSQGSEIGRRIEVIRGVVRNHVTRNRQIRLHLWLCAEKGILFSCWSHHRGCRAVLLTNARAASASCSSDSWTRYVSWNHATRGGWRFVASRTKDGRGNDGGISVRG